MCRKPTLPRGEEEEAKRVAQTGPGETLPAGAGGSLLGARDPVLIKCTGGPRDCVRDRLHRRRSSRAVVVTRTVACTHASETLNSGTRAEESCGVTISRFRESFR